MAEKQEILLESGTNEFEIVEFTVGGVTYGINVAKVREVINDLPYTQMANSHPYVDGIFSLRGRIMPLVNLARCVGATATNPKGRIIVSELNNFYVGFRVDEVSRIHRISWTALEPAPSIAGSELVVGIVKMEDRLIVLLDFEKLVSDVNPDIKRKLSESPSGSPALEVDRKKKTILIAEDSFMLRELLRTTLSAAGYSRTICLENGQSAWDWLESAIEQDKELSQIDIVITDIEMPKMDGHHLLKRIKDHSLLRSLPVVIFSSLINEEMRRKGDALGAAAQVTKPEIAQLISILDDLLIAK